MNRALDIIGDIHGRFATFKDLLWRLGWRPDGDLVRHPEDRLLVSIGDVLNKGEDPLGVLEFFEGMIAAGRAAMILGNHEMNAVHYMRGLRPRTPGTTRQFATTLAQIEARPERWARAENFIRQLPFALEFDQGRLRLVHACWPLPGQSALPGNLLRDEDLIATGEGGPLQAAALHCVKGPEVAVAPYVDAEGVRRHRDRIAWWEGLPPEAPLTVFGHYCFPWPHRPGAPTEPGFLGPGRNAVGLDFGAGRGDRLVALRWPERRFEIVPVR
ncbi:MAG: metallophosphoesterase [Planctomycetes bacterium]|nr:metallophosphoesterase [Planctomycetota bacterium]